MRALAVIAAGLVFIGVASAAVFSDNFERASLGSNWTVQGGSGAGIVNNSDLGILPGGGVCVVHWAHGLGMPANQFSQATISSGIPSTVQRGVFVRRRASDKARYQFHWNLGVSPQRWELKYDGVSPGVVMASTTVGSPPGPGATLKISAQGTLIRGYLNGSLILSVTDTRIATGTPGMAFFSMSGPSSQPTPVFESWTGDTP